MDNNDIAFFVYGGTYIEGDILTELKSSVQILNITNPEKKIINCECPQLEDHSLFCNLVPLKIKGKIGVGIVFDLEIFIFLKSNEGEKYVNLKKIDNFGTLKDFYIYKNFFVSYDYYGLNYYDIDKDFELKTHNNLKTEDINVETDFLFQNSSEKVQVNDHIFIYPFKKNNSFKKINLLFFDHDKCKTINTFELKGNEFNVKCEFEVQQMLFFKNYLLILIQLLQNGSSKLLKYSIDEATLNINFISSLDLGNSKENSIFFKRNQLYILKYDNHQNKKVAKLQIYDIDI